MIYWSDRLLSLLVSLTQAKLYKLLLNSDIMRNLSLGAIVAGVLTVSSLSGCSTTPSYEGPYHDRKFGETIINGDEFKVSTIARGNKFFLTLTDDKRYVENGNLPVILNAKGRRSDGEINSVNIMWGFSEHPFEKLSKEDLQEIYLGYVSR